MPRSSRGAITLFDVTDGTNPITAFLTNENHTFSADQTGTVTAATRRMFESNLTVFVGGTQASYLSTLSTTDGTTGQTANRFRISGVVVTGTSGFTAGFNDTAAAADIDTISRDPGDIYLTATPTDPVGAATLTVTFAVSNELGTVTAGLVAEISVSIVSQGAGGVVINIDPSSQFFTADSDGVLDASQTAITLDVLSQGSTGAITVATSQNGAGFINQTTAGTTAGAIAGWDDDNAGAFQTGTIGTTIRRLQIAQTNLGDSNNTLSIRITGASGGNDVVTIAKVRDGVEGASALIITVESSTSGSVFRTSGGSTPADKTLSVRVFDASSGAEILTAGISNYDWFRGDGTTAVNVDNATDRNVQTSGGVAASGSGFSTIVVGSADISNEEAFYCEVTTTT